MAIKVGVGLSTLKDHIQATKEAVGQARFNLGKDKISLVLVFSSIEFAHPNILKTIWNLLGAIAIVGCSSLAVIVERGVFKHAIAIMLLSLPEGVFFNTALVKEISKKYAVGAGEELGEKLLFGCKGVRRDLSLIFSDGLIPDGAGLIYGLQEKLGSSFPLIGACASDNLSFQKTYVYFNQEILNDAACGILWGGRLNFGLGIKHGWKPLGKPRRITKSKGNVVNEIDNAPAIKLYKEYLGRDISALKKDLRRISILYPIGMRLAGEEEYLLRNILSVEDDGSLILQGDVPQESLIRLMIGSKESCLAATTQALDEVKKGLRGASCNFALVFNSISRYILLGRQINKELEILQQGLGKNIPIMGICSFGEQAPLMSVNYLGRTYFHNQTITILAMGG